MPTLEEGRSSFALWGGTATVLTTDPDRIGPALDALRDQVTAADAAFSRFRPDSELSRINAAAGRHVAVSVLFAEVMAAALRAAELTGGDVDPTCGAGLVAAGYDRDFEQLRAAGVTVKVHEFVPAAGWRSVSWDPTRRLLRLPDGARLDFGAVAKAFTADRAAGRARAAAGCGVLISLSGDLAVAGDAPAGGWRVRVTDDHRSSDDSPGQTVTLSDGGLATSSTTVRRWTGAGDVGGLHHILDPRSGRPADSCWRTVSVAAATCVDANIAATAAIIRGAEAADWLHAMRLPARLVRRDGSVVTVGSWPTQPGEGAP